VDVRHFSDIRTFLTYFSLGRLAIKSGIRCNNSIEIGSGTGTYSLWLKKLKIINNAYLVDVSENAIKASQELFRELDEKAYFVLADGLALPFRDKSFDLSLSGGLIEHFDEEERQNIVHEHCRVSNKVLCQIPLNNPAYWVGRYLQCLFYRGWPFGYEKPSSLREIEKMFSAENFLVEFVSYHDLLTAAAFRLSKKFCERNPLKNKGYVNKIFRHEVVVYAYERHNRNKRHAYEKKF